MRYARIALLVSGLLGFTLAAQADDAQMFDPVFRQGAASDLLVDGTPALARGHLDAYVDLLESAFDIALLPAQEQGLRDALETAFEKGDAGHRAGLLELVTPIARLRAASRKGEHATLREGMRRFRIALDERMRAAPRNPAHRIIAEALDQRHADAWPGRPPVSRGPADAYLELVRFVVSLGRNQDVTLTDGKLTVLRAGLGAQLHAKPHAVRQQLARAHRTWLKTKGAWDAADEKRRFRIRAAAVQFMARVQPAGRALKVDVGNSLPSYARAAALVAASQSPFKAMANAARNPAAVLEAVTESLGIIGPEPEFSLSYRTSSYR